MSSEVELRKTLAGLFGSSVGSTIADLVVPVFSQYPAELLHKRNTVSVGRNPDPLSGVGLINGSHPKKLLSSGCGHRHLIDRALTAQDVPIQRHAALNCCTISLRRPDREPY